jgi:formate C-acetyltransferase
MTQSGLIAKGFTKPTARIAALKNAIIDAMPVIETERAILVTEVYKETEHLSPIMRRAKVVEKLLNNMHVTIRDNELIVGSLTKNIRSSEIGIEYSFEWLEQEFDTIHARATDPFIITEESKRILKEQVFPYWRGKTLSDYSLSMMSPECKETFDYAVFNPTNYLFAGVAHSVIYYERVLHTGFKGVLKDVIEAMEKTTLRKWTSTKRFSSHLQRVSTTRIAMPTKRKRWQPRRATRYVKPSCFKSRKTAVMVRRTAQGTSTKPARRSG